MTDNLDERLSDLTERLLRTLRSNKFAATPLWDVGTPEYRSGWDNSMDKAVEDVERILSIFAYDEKQLRGEER
jgi:hypothetical protein